MLSQVTYRETILEGRLTLDELIQHSVDVRSRLVGHHPAPSGHLQPAVFHQPLHDHFLRGVGTGNRETAID